MKKKTKTRKNTAVTNADYKELSNQFRLLTDFMENIPDVIYFKDTKGRLILVNRAHAEGLGLKPEQVVGKTDFEIFPKNRAELMAKDDQYVIKTGKPIIDKIERATRADGIDNYVSTTKIPRYDDKGKIIGLMGITRDVTKRVRYEQMREDRISKGKTLEMMEDFNRIKSDFISAVSHELRTPLAIINQLLLLIYNETVGPINDQQREILVKARYNIDRQKGIIDKMLDMSRIEGKTLTFRYSLININDLLKDSKGFFKELAAEKNILLNYLLPKKDVSIFIDAERIMQVLTNLINNAIKFTEENGEITVEVKVLEDRIRIGVIDTGIGIAEPDLSRVFEKFVQVSGGESAGQQGVGLGLSIVKELVKKHGGDIWIESYLGAGSKIYFTLPRFYTANILGKPAKDKINQLLEKYKSVYLINLLIVDWDAFNKRIEMEPQALFKKIRTIMETAHKEMFPSGKAKQQIVITDMHKGKYSIIFPETRGRKVTAFCELIKEKTKVYFIKNKIENVFIALGILSYSSKVPARGLQRESSNLNIKEIYIGAEMRRSKRISYKTSIEVVSPEKEKQKSETIDLSQHGACFVSRNPLKTDSNIKVRIELLKKKKTISAEARVAWLSKLEHLPGEIFDKYKTGLDFVDISKEDNKILASELKLYYE